MRRVDAVARLLVFLGPVLLALWIFCVFHVIVSRDDEVRHLPKLVWLLVVLFFPLVGSLAWLLAGRPVKVQAAGRPYEREASAFPEYDRPGRAAAVDEAADEEFLRRCRERAEEQRRKYREDKDGAAEGA